MGSSTETRTPDCHRCVIPAALVRQGGTKTEDREDRSYRPSLEDMLTLVPRRSSSAGASVVIAFFGFFLDPSAPYSCLPVLTAWPVVIG